MGTAASTLPRIKKRKIFLLYPYYWPLYKAGGPVQSLFNLAGLFREEADFFVISKNKDIDGSNPEMNLTVNQWIAGPQGEQVFYSSSITTLLIYRLMRFIQPDLVIVNGMFNPNTSFNGILVTKWLRIKLVISPRGMLQSWGLKRNGLVKRIYLWVVRKLLRKDEVWHATDVQEKNDIISIFGDKQVISIASNVPAARLQTSTLNRIQPGQKIRLLFLSLINKNKNLHLVIESAKKMKESFSLEIYGPVIDKAYWETCRQLINGADNIEYKGPVPPWEVPKIFAGAHFFVLPTEGENFGHAIFDSLSAGTPVITTEFTPWKNLDASKAGFYINLKNSTSLDSILLHIKSMNGEAYQSLREGSLSYARNYLQTRDFKSEYEFLFRAG